MMSDHLMQTPVLLFGGMMVSFILVLAAVSIEDALRDR